MDMALIIDIKWKNALKHIYRNKENKERMSTRVEISAKKKGAKGN